MPDCYICGSKLKDERWVRSSHTKRHYCMPGEGCFVSKTTTFEDPQEREQEDKQQARPAKTAVLQDLSEPFLPALET